MTGSSETPADDPGTDLLSTVGLLLNVGGVICIALWLSMIGGAYRGGSAAVVGIAAIAGFAASFVCFAAGRPVSSGRYPTAP